VQRVAETQEMPSKKLLPGAVGTGTTVHIVPFHSSASALVGLGSGFWEL